MSLIKTHVINDQKLFLIYFFLCRLSIVEEGGEDHSFFTCVQMQYVLQGTILSILLMSIDKEHYGAKRTVQNENEI